MQVSVGTTPVRLDVAGAATPLVQNLGPGDVYVDRADDVSDSTGVELAVGDVLELPRGVSSGGGPLYLVATESDTDVRYLEV